MSQELQQMRSRITKIKQQTKISQITISRIIKSPKRGGDIFISMTANYGHGEDSFSEEMLSNEEAKLASFILGKEVNIVAHQQAGAGGLLTENQMNFSIEKIKHNFNHLIIEASKNER